MNHSDSERIAGFLEGPLSNSLLRKERGHFVAAKNINEADLVIFNTCGVRQSAEDRVYGQVHNLKAKNQNLKTKIILTGCLANRKDVQRRLKDKVDLFCEIKNFPEEILSVIAIRQLAEKQSRTLMHKTRDCRGRSETELPRNDNYLNIQPKYGTKFSAYVPIMTGCNNYCSYCVVPYARGREVSRPAAEIIKEVKYLVKKGYKEIVLLGQNVNSYKDVSSLFPSPSSGRRWREAPDEGKINFSQLLKKINAIPGNFWISFISNHPKDMTDEMIETVTKCKKVCECFHLPVQAGNDEVIRRMNRKYAAKEYLKLVDKIKKAYKKYKPGILYSITSDIIVGFPGETRKQFLDSAEVMKKAKFDMVYFGQYSPRPSTASWNMKDNVSKKEKERREKYLNEILKQTSFENNKKYIGKNLEIIITHAKTTGNLSRERLPKKRDGVIEYFGRTRTMKNVKINLSPTLSLLRRKGKHGNDNLIGKFVKVKITKANIWNLEGILIET